MVATKNGGPVDIHRVIKCFCFLVMHLIYLDVNWQNILDQLLSFSLCLNEICRAPNCLVTQSFFIRYRH